MPSFSELIRDLGVHRLAEAFGVDAAHVRVMRARNSVPPLYWGQLVSLAEHAGMSGVDLSSLRALREERFASEARASLPAPSTPEAA